MDIQTHANWKEKRCNAQQYAAKKAASFFVDDFIVFTGDEDHSINRRGFGHLGVFFL